MTKTLELQLVAEFPEILSQYVGSNGFDADGSNESILGAEQRTSISDDEVQQIFGEGVHESERIGIFFGFAHGDGWYDLVRELCLRLDAIRQATGIASVARLVKQKFGVLRFYYRTKYYSSEEKNTGNEAYKWEDIIRAVVEQAQRESLWICGITGKPGRLCRKEGWFVTLSDEEAFKNGFQSTQS